MNNFVDLILYRLAHLGQIPICNGEISRAPILFGYCFPLCYRCTFIFIVFFITLFICYKYKKGFHLGILMLCLIPMIIDGTLQTFGGIESTNIRRMITGGIFGFGLGGIVSKLHGYVDKRL